MRKDWYSYKVNDIIDGHFNYIHFWIDTKFMGLGINARVGYVALYFGPINFVVSWE